jgi:hypothetical protein
MKKIVMKKLSGLLFIAFFSLTANAQYLDSATVMDETSPSSVHVFGSFWSSGSFMAGIQNFDLNQLGNSDTLRMDVFFKPCGGFAEIIPFDTIFDFSDNLENYNVLMARSVLFNADSTSESCDYQPIPTFFDSVYAPRTILGTSDKFQKPKISIYPNPVKGNLILKTPPDFGLREVKLYDLKGRLISEFPSGQRNFDVSGLPSGLYCLVLRSASYGLITEKVVIE